MKFTDAKKVASHAKQQMLNSYLKMTQFYAGNATDYAATKIVEIHWEMINEAKGTCPFL